jgi:pimeloyl-ACP methyl ester carboxylesterase
MEIHSYPNSQAYVFPNDKSDTLVISMDGSGWTSVLGTREGNNWTTTKMGAQLLQVLNNNYTFFIPEKLKRQPGESYYNNMEDRANNTAENLIACYTESINGYLAENNFSSIVLIGTSEGAMLLPLVYERMNNKDKVSAMVSYAFGGLSWSESYTILSKRTDIPEGRFPSYFNLPRVFNPTNKEIYDSYEENYHGNTVRYFNSVFNIRPFDYYKNIDIPILFIHGENDFNTAVESTQYIQKNLPDKPFEYRYYPWEHQPETYHDKIQLRKDIAEWIMEKTL